MSGYTKRTDCRFCHSRDLIPFLDFGEIPLAGGFLTEEEIPQEMLYPFKVCFCQNCALVQVEQVIPADLLFKKYFYFSSKIKTLVDHFEAFAAEIALTLPSSTPFVVEIGCNDGVLLKPLIARGVKAIGVEPATNIVESSPLRQHIINDFFSEELALRIRKEHGEADAVLSSFSLAHIDDMDDVMRGITALLKGDGVLIFEIYYLGTILEETQYDMMYHEHHSYYSLIALAAFLERFGMEIFRVKRIPLRAGTVRFYAGEKGAHPIHLSVEELLEEEREKGYGSIDAYLDFASEVRWKRNDLLLLLRFLKNKGKSVAGYGASGRAAIIMNYCSIDSSLIDYVVDDSPSKQGCLMPGMHVPIRSWDTVEASPPDYIVVFAWPFLSEIIEKRGEYLENGGNFIIPLPKIKMMPGGA